MKRFLFIAISVIAISVSGCKQADGIDAKYEVMGFQITEKALAENVRPGKLPTFIFQKNNEVIIKPDLTPELFKDTVFEYEFTPSSLKLQSKNIRGLEFDFPISRDSGMIDIMLDTKYLYKISLVEVNNE